MKKFVDLLKILGPAIMFASGVPPVAIPMILIGIEEAEAIPGAKGRAKLDAAVKLANTIMGAVNTAKPGVINIGEVNEVITTGINTTIATINLVQKKPAPAVNIPIPGITGTKA